MTVKYINSKNEVLEFIGADILPTSGYLHQRKWNTNKENDITVIDKGDCTYTPYIERQFGTEKKHA